MIKNNDEAITLINTKSGLLLNSKNMNEELDEELKNFVQHANLFKALWKSIVDKASHAEIGRDKLMTPAFPERLDDLLAMEIKKRNDALTANSSRIQAE